MTRTLLYVVHNRLSLYYIYLSYEPITYLYQQRCGGGYLTKNKKTWKVSESRKKNVQKFFHETRYTLQIFC